ncbi:MAG: shikimate dehydrogenase [Actinomycetota bacterium]|nr:shikimate dehydrogenase [Actinomycetota bacterium]
MSHVVTGSTRLAAVIGDPVRHSLSPVLHNAAFAALDLDWVYVALPVQTGDGGRAVAAMSTLGIDGLNVTMPHKAAVAEAVDRCSPVAARLGAVNTVVRTADGLLGDSTDGEGFLTALRVDEGFDPDGARCLVVGAGGAARAVVLALAEAGASEVVVVARREAAATAAASLAGSAGRPGTAEEADGCALVVNATPLGMDAVVVELPGAGILPELPVPERCLGPGQVVADLVYQPMRTPFIEAARARGAVAVNGLGMLIHQAALSFRLWTGEDPPLEVLSAAALAELARRSAASPPL